MVALGGTTPSWLKTEKDPPMEAMVWLRAYMPGSVLVTAPVLAITQTTFSVARLTELMSVFIAMRS